MTPITDRIRDVGRDIEMTYEMLFAFLQLHSDGDSDAAWTSARDQVSAALVAAMTPTAAQEEESCGRYLSELPCVRPKGHTGNCSGYCCAEDEPPPSLPAVPGPQDEAIERLRRAVIAWDDKQSSMAPLFREEAVWDAVRSLLKVPGPQEGTCQACGHRQPVANGNTPIPSSLAMQGWRCEQCGGQIVVTFTIGTVPSSPARAEGPTPARCHALMVDAGKIRECGAVIQGDKCFNGHPYTADRHRVPPAAPGAEDGTPILLNDWQQRAVKQWAADDRLWTTQETVEFNLRTFARTILATASQAPAARGALDETIERIIRVALEKTPGGVGYHPEGWNTDDELTFDMWREAMREVLQPAPPQGQEER